MTDEELADLELALHSSEQFEADPNYARVAALIEELRKRQERISELEVRLGEGEPSILPPECEHGWNPADCLECGGPRGPELNQGAKAVLNLKELNPGIRATVAWLRENGFETCDSGDGETRDFDCDLDEPYVHMVVPKGMLVAEADRLLRLLRQRGVTIETANEVGDSPSIAATYDPAGGPATLSLFNVKL